MSNINDLGRPDYSGQIYALGVRVANVETRFAPIESGQASFDARLTALEESGGGSGGGGDMYKSQNLSGLTNYVVARNNLGVTATGQDVTYLYRGNNLSDLTNASAARSNLGLGSLATQSGTFSGSSSGTNTGDQTSVTGNAGTATKLQTARNINGVAFDGSAAITINAVDSTARQPLDGDLTALAALTGTNTIYYRSGADTWSPVTIGANLTFTSGTLSAAAGGGGGGGDMYKADNLSGLASYPSARANLGSTTVGDAIFTAASASAARGTLGLGTISTQPASNVAITGGSIAGITDLAVADGGTGASTASAARTNLGAAAVTDLSLTVNFTADGVARIPARVAQTIDQGNAPLGTGTLAYAKSTSGAPGTFTSTTLPATLQAGAWLQVTASGVSGYLAADLYRTA